VSPLPTFAALRLAQAQGHRQRDATHWGVSAATVALGGGLAFLALRLWPAPPPIPPSEPPAAAIAIALAAEPAPAPAPPQPPSPSQTTAALPEAEIPPKIAAPPSPASDPPVPVPAHKSRPKMPPKTPAKIAPKTPQVQAAAPAAQPTTPPPDSSGMAPAGQGLPAQGAPATSAFHDPVSWRGALLARLERFKRYPAESQTNHEEGTVMLHFTMDRSGRVLSAHIVGSAHHPLLDEETLSLVRRAQPLPAPPDSIRGETLSLTVPVEFYMNR